MKLELKRFSFDIVPKDGRTFLIVGKKGTGKSVLLEDFLYNMKDRYDCALAMAPTKTSIDMFKQHVPPAFVYEEGLDVGVFNRVLNLCKEIKSTSKYRHIVSIFDDCNADKTLFRMVMMRDAFMNGRHYNISMMFAVQYLMDLDIALRSQIDFIIILKEQMQSIKKRLWEQFFGCFKQFKDFDSVLDEMTKDHGCLILDNTKPNPKPQDCCYWYKANMDLPPFRLGKPIFFELSEYYGVHQQKQQELLKIRIPRPGQKMSEDEMVSLPHDSIDENNPRIQFIERVM